MACSAAGDWGVSATSAGDDWGASATAAAGDDWGVSATDAKPADDWGVAIAAGDDWGAPATSTDDWGTAGTGQAAPNDNELDGLLRARAAAAGGTATAIASAAAAPTAKAREEAVPDAAKAADDWRGVCDASMTGALPPFALEISEEPGKVNKHGDYEVQLLERYKSRGDEGEDEGPSSAEAAQGEPWPDDAATVSGSKKGQGSKKAGGGASSSGPNNTTGGAQGDEEGAELAGDEWFLKFQRRLARSPSQVVRYAWGGKPLWISAPPEEVGNRAWPPPCPRCGAARTFELQLLPTLLCEVRRWCPDAVGDWDIEWGTVMVYTCSKDCTGDEPAREFIVAQPAV